MMYDAAAVDQEYQVRLYNAKREFYMQRQIDIAAVPAVRAAG